MVGSGEKEGQIQIDQMAPHMSSGYLDSAGEAIHSCLRVCAREWGKGGLEEVKEYGVRGRQGEQFVVRGAAISTRITHRSWIQIPGKGRQDETK